MAADEADEKKPENDPWADLMAESLGDSADATEADDSADAAAFNFLDADDAVAATDSAVEHEPTFDFTTESLEADDLGGLPQADDLSGLPQPEDLSGLPQAENLGEPVLGGAAAEGDTAGPAAAEPEFTETFAEELFADDRAETEPPPLSVFAPDDTAAGQPSPSSIEIATGLSGIRLDEEEAAAAAAEDAVSPASDDDARDADPWDSIGTDDVDDDTTEAAETFAFGVTTEDDGESAAAHDEPAPREAPVVAAVAAPKSVPQARKKQGGIGQTIGVVLGGLMAIPITLGILIWGLQRDPFGITKQVPPQLAFLLPQKFQPGFKKTKRGAGRTVATAGGSSLDDVAAASAELGGDGAPADTNADATIAPGDALAAGDMPVGESLPLPEPAFEPDIFDPSRDGVAAVEPAQTEPPDTALAATSPQPAGPGVDDFDAAVFGNAPPSEVPQPAPPAEPEPLDMSGLDAAVTAAEESLAAVSGISDFETREGRRAVIDWYRSLARVAEELTMLERVASDSARPFAAAPRRIGDLHRTIAAQPRLLEQLALLGPMWLAFEKRDHDGVVLAVEFGTSRPVGPWWLSTVAYRDVEGMPHELAVVSRAEPTVTTGDPVLITGVVFGADVVWAADCRSAAEAAETGSAQGESTEEATQPEPAAADVFSLPEF